MLTSKQRSLRRLIKQNKRKSRNKPKSRGGFKRELKEVFNALRNYKHVLSIIITLTFFLFGIFLFGNSFTRLTEAFKDFGISFIFAFEADVTPTVNQLPSVNLEDLGVLPTNLDTAAIKFSLYGKLLINKENFIQYGYFLCNVLYVLSYVLLISLPVILSLVLIVWCTLMSTNNKYNCDTKPLKIAKRISEFTYVPIRNWIKGYITFLREHKAYLIIWAVIWIFNFNFPTILIEIFAFYFYFVATFDLPNLYVQIYKLVLDLSIVIKFIPVWLWVIIGLVIYDLWRRRHAYHKLKKLEEGSEEFVKEMPVSTLIVAPMNMKKTTMLTDITITFNKVFRDIAYAKLLENDLKFPNFPWINLERCIKFGMERHLIYNLATCKRFTDTVRKVFDKSSKYPQLSGVFKGVMKRRYGYDYQNNVFDYSIERYGGKYYDKLEPKTIFDVIETYTKLYFIYVISCNLIISSYSIRTDDILKDKGNFPLWDINFFKRDEKLMQAHSRHSHIIDYDALRLGTLVCKDSRFKDSIDFGIISITEIGKERGNQKTQTGKKDDEQANQNNDLLANDIKMCRHRATVDNYPFVVFVDDEQRAASLNANERELGDVITITDSSDFKMITPLFALDELIYIGATKLFTKYYKLDRHNKGNNTLSRRIIKGLYGFIYRHYFNLYNMYSVSTLKLSVQSGKQDDEGKAKKYKLSKKKIHAARFSTDAFAAYYHEKTLRSPVGIVDIPEYAGKTASFDELELQHSYFVRDITKSFISNKEEKTDESN